MKVAISNSEVFIYPQKDWNAHGMHILATTG